MDARTKLLALADAWDGDAKLYRGMRDEGQFVSKPDYHAVGKGDVYALCARQLREAVQEALAEDRRWVEIERFRDELDAKSKDEGWEVEERVTFGMVVNRLGLIMRGEFT